MARIPEEVIQSVQDSVDIVDVISRYVTLKKSGASFKGLCPFHEEKTPSFTVFPVSGRFKCFGCGEGGTVFTFLMKRNNLGFREVIEELARETGVALPESENDPADAERARRRGAALEALRFAAAFFRVVLQRDTGAPARTYLEGRGYTTETVEAFELGFSPDQYEGLLSYARGKGIGEQALEDAGLVRRNERGQLYDMFRGRIMFPIHDLRGSVIGFGARAMGDAAPKYLNSPDSSLFHKGREMYGLQLARSPAVEAGRLLVVEGYTDVMQCHQAGLREVAAGLGTALTVENAQRLRRIGVPVFLVYDGDDAGRRAAERAAEVLLAEKVDGAVALLPAGKDPADLVVESGTQGLETALEKAEDLWAYRMERALERQDLATMGGSEKVVLELKDALARIADPIRQDVAFKLLAERTGVHESTLRNQIRVPEARMSQKEGALTSRAWVRAEKALLRATLQDEAFWDSVEDVYPPEEFRDPDLREVAGAIRDLRHRGESVTREAVLGMLADNDRAAQALQELEPADDARDQAASLLDCLTDRMRLQAALARHDLEAVVRARKDSSAVTR